MNRLILHDRDTAIGRLILFTTDGHEIKEIDGSGFTEIIYYYPRYLIYDSVNSKFYFIASIPSLDYLHGDLVKATNPATIDWIVPAVNFQFDPDAPLYLGGQSNTIVKIVLGSDGNIYIATRVRIYVYDSAGAYVTDFGGFGFGDSEFCGIVDFTESAGFLYVTEFYQNPFTENIKKLQNDGAFIFKKDVRSVGYTFGDRVSCKIAVDATNIYLVNERYLAPFHTISTVYKKDLNGNDISNFDLAGTDSIVNGLIGSFCIINSAGELIVVYYTIGAVSTINRWNLGGALLGSELMSNIASGNDGIVYQDTANTYWISSISVTPSHVDYGFPIPVEVIDAGFGFNLVGPVSNFYDAGVVLPYDLTTIGGIAYLNKKIFKVDQNHSQVYIFDNNLNYISLFGGLGGADGQFNHPEGIAADRLNNRLVICDSGNHRIQVFDGAGIFIFKFSGSMTEPLYDAVDNRNGNIYMTQPFADNNVRKYNSAGVYQFSFGGTGVGDGKFDFPTGICVDGVGNVYVIDSGHRRIQKFTEAGIFITKWDVPDDGFGWTDGINVIAGTDDLIYFLDDDNFRVRVYDLVGNFVRDLGQGIFGDGWEQFDNLLYGDFIEVASPKVPFPILPISTRIGFKPLMPILQKGASSLLSIADIEKVSFQYNNFTGTAPDALSAYIPFGYKSLWLTIIAFGDIVIDFTEAGTNPYIVYNDPRKKIYKLEVEGFRIRNLIPGSNVGYQILAYR